MSKDKNHLPATMNSPKERLEQVIRKQNILLDFNKKALGETCEIFQHITETLATFFDIERVSIWISDNVDNSIICTDFFDRKENTHGSGVRMLFQDYPDYFDTLKKNACIVADDVTLDVRYREFVHPPLSVLGIQSKMDFPINIEEKLRAVVCCEKSGTKKKWTLEEQDFVSSVTDIISLVIKTEENRKLILRLQESEEDHRNIIDNAVVGIYKTNFSGQILYVNQALVDILEFESIEEALSYDILKTYKNKKDRDSFLAHLSEKKSTHQHELTLVSKRGNLRHVLISSFAEGENILGMIMDITDRKKVEEDLHQARLKAEESDRLKTSLMANMSHEFRTPMNAILGFAALITSESHDPDIVFFAQKIHTAGQRLMITLKSILDLADLEGTKSKLKLQEINVQKTLHSTLQPFYPVANERNLYLITELKDNLIALADENLLQMILFNLIDNAVKFTHQGGITIETDIRKVNDESRIVILIKDTGIGISKEYFSTIFHEFRQLSEGFNRSYEGNGLGLTLAQRMAGMINGYITVESEVGLGSIFTLWLPASLNFSRQTMVDLEYIPVSPHTPALHIYEPRELPLVLIVEDNDDNAEIIKLYLKGKFRTERASDAYAAISMASMQQFDGVLMDINLGPGIDGLKAAKEIRKLDHYQNVPIIAITGYTMSGDQEKLLAGGCSHYLGKPFSQQGLLELMQSTIKCH